MALKSFKIQNVKALGLVECELVPSVMIIAGSNGVGKSTLLYELAQRRGIQADENTKILYQPPHRALRKTTVQRRWLFGGVIKLFSDLLSQNDVSGYEGLQIQFPSRTPDNVDEAGSTIKYTLGKIENRRQTILAELVDKAKKSGTDVTTANIPDIYKPLRELTKYLLPHLVFDRIDFQNENNIRCIWKRIDKQGEIELDLDDLSSGEKSIVILFLPLLENEINALLESITKDPTVPSEPPDPLPDRVLIIDEPELHLHPDLQSKILTYLRSLSGQSNLQFVVTTHSPTILDQALDSELFVLGFKGDDPTKNQLKKVATNLDRLEALKQLAGDTYLITTGRSIVCIEGDADVAARPADVRLFQILYPRSTAYTFIPAGGKGEVIKIVKKLREYLPEDAFGIKIFGLTDMDQSKNGTDGIFILPVCMIENLLLNPKGMLSYLNTVDVRSFSTPEEIDAELSGIATSLKEEEISYRVMREIGAHTVRFRGNSIEEIKRQLVAELNQVQKLIPEDPKLDELIKSITTEVEKIIADGQTKQYFRGKKILETFYNKHLAGKNIPYSGFCYELGNHIAMFGDVEKILNPIFDQMN